MGVFITSLHFYERIIGGSPHFYEGIGFFAVKISLTAIYNQGQI